MSLVSSFLLALYMLLTFVLGHTTHVPLQYIPSQARSSVAATGEMAAHPSAHDAHGRPSAGADG